MKIKLLNKIWEVCFVASAKMNGKKRARANGLNEGDRGDCDPPTAKNKKIRVADNLPPVEQLEVLIHECLHATDWFKDEEWVEQVAKDISRLLWRLGWRPKNKER